MLSEIYLYNPSESTFWSDVLSTFVGTVIPILIFLSGMWWDKYKERTRARTDDLNNMRYLYSLVKGISKFVKTQRKKYYEHANNINNDPTERHLLQIVIAEDLNRALLRDNHAKLYHSFLAVKGNGQENTDKFHILFSNLDLLKGIYDQAIDGQKRYLELNHTQKVEYRALVEDRIMGQCVKMINLLKSHNPEYMKDPVFVVIDNAFFKYFNQQGGYPTIKRLHEEYLAPLQDGLLENIDNTLVAKLLEECRKATYLYNDIVFHSTNTANEFKIHGDNFAEPEKILESYSDLLSITHVQKADQKIF